MSTISSRTVQVHVPACATTLSALGGLQWLLLAVIVLEMPLQIDSYLFFQERWASVGAIGGFNLSLTTICLGALYFTWLFEFATSTALTWQRRILLSYPLTAYLLIAAASCIIAENRLLALNSIFLLFQLYLLYTYVANRVQTKQDVTFLVSLLLVAIAVQGAIVIGLHFVGRDIQLGPIVGTVWPDGRVAGTLGSPNSAASYLSLLIAPAVAVLTTPVSHRTKWLAIVAITTGMIGIVFTMSRGGWIATGVSVSLLCSLAWYRGRISAWLLIMVALVGLLVAGIFHDSIGRRFMADDRGSAQARMSLAQSAWYMIGDHPIVGVGANNSAVVGSRYAMRPEFRQDWFYITHNKYLLEWEELGVIGLGAFLWFLLSTLRTGWQAWRIQDALLAPIALGLAIAIFGQMLHMMVDTFNDRTSMQALWLSAALIAAIHRVQEDDGA